MKLRLVDRGRKRLVLGGATCVVACAMAAALQFAPGVGYVERRSGLNHFAALLWGTRVKMVLAKWPPPGFNGPSTSGVDETPAADYNVNPPQWGRVWTRDPRRFAPLYGRNEECTRLLVAWDPSAHTAEFSAWNVPGCIAAIGMGLSAWGWLAMRRRLAGACARCGYDLRGLAVATACPECGCASTSLAPVTVKAP